MSSILKLAPLLKPYWKRSLAALAFLTALVFMDLSIPRLIQRIIDQGIKQHSQIVVLHTSLLMLVISALSALMAIANNYLSVRVAESFGRDLRDALFLKIQSFSHGNLDRMQTGQLMVRLTSDVSAVQRVAQVTLRVGTRAPMMMIGSLILMIETSKSLALSMLPLLFVTSGLIVFFVVKMEPLFLLAQQKMDKLNTVLQENVAGARLVKAFVRADFECGRFERANKEFADNSTRAMQLMACMTPALTVCVNIGVVFVIWAGGLQSIRGEMTLGQIVAFANYLMTTMTPLVFMTMLSNVWAAGIASARRVNEVFETAPEIQDAPDAVDLPSRPEAEVVFENVAFHYGENGGQLVLDGVSLTISPGETVAILGATGSGKTSLVNLVPRFYDVNAGRILVNGVDLRRLRRDSLLARIGVVPQEAVLFSGTVRDNIRYGRPDAGDDEVVKAAMAAQAHEFIQELPGGYDARIEQRGANLSGGQRQRLAIARALAVKPEILILDDSTSAVDVETETRIQGALNERMRGSACLVVAQRISTVLNADKIIVIENGRIAAEGTHRNLLRTSPIYREIYDSQLGDGSSSIPPPAAGSRSDQP